MREGALESLISLARRKAEFDKNNEWYKGPGSYLSGLRDELDEVIEEIPKGRLPYLEAELGDLLWVYLNAVLALEKETDIRLESVLNRAKHKFEERMSGIESGKAWKDIKAEQNEALARECLNE